EAARLPALVDELRRRGGQVPALRLPWPAAGVAPEGYATEVRLPLRAGAEPAVRSALDALDPTLLLALPGLAQIEVCTPSRGYSEGDGRVSIAAQRGAERAKEPSHGYSEGDGRVSIAAQRGAERAKEPSREYSEGDGRVSIAAQRGAERAKELSHGY